MSSKAQTVVAEETAEQVTHQADFNKNAKTSEFRREFFGKATLRCDRCNRKLPSGYGFVEVGANDGNKYGPVCKKKLENATVVKTPDADASKAYGARIRQHLLEDIVSTNDNDIQPDSYDPNGWKQYPEDTSEAKTQETQITETLNTVVDQSIDDSIGEVLRSLSFKEEFNKKASFTQHVISFVKAKTPKIVKSFFKRYFK